MVDTSARHRALPQGTVTFLFTDIEGSTRLLQQLGHDYAKVLATHHERLRQAFERHHGTEVDTQGDAFFVAFARAHDAVAAAVDSQRALLAEGWPHGRPLLVRMGLHTGEPVVIDDEYVGIDVHRAARISSAAHGGQVVVSHATYRLLADDLNLGLEFQDLGHHRLKDLDEAEHLLQVIAEGLPSEFPPLRSLLPPTNLPRHLDPLVGRHEETRALRALLAGDEARLVTVTGPGGIGKTRLSAAVALQVRDAFAGGAYLVDLTRVQSPELVATEIASVLDIPLDGGRPHAQTIAGNIGNQRVLLVLDNFEQVLEAATVVSEVLQACPHLTVLVTSRILLSIQGEREFALAPLGLPKDNSLEEVAHSEAVQLFVERAARRLPSFALTGENAASIAEICELLDGLPLAIELAAARVKLLSPEAILERLDDRLRLLTGGTRDSPERHRTLRTTIDWSYELLAAEERAVFRDLSVFTGGATLDALENVLGGDIDTLETLSSLINHSLVRRREDSAGDARFTMLQTIREYALELLAAHPKRADVLDRHADYYLGVAEKTLYSDPDAPSLTGDLDNLRTALAWWLERAAEEPERYGASALRLATQLGHYAYRHGLAVEGSTWLERALEVGDDAPEEVRARSLRVLGVLMEQRRDMRRARELFEEALELYRKRGDRAGEGACLNSLGVVARAGGEREEAEELYEGSLAIRRALDDKPGISTVLSNLGILWFDRGDLDRAQALLEEAIQYDREEGNRWGIACTMHNLGVVHLEQGDAAKARSSIEEALHSFVELDDLDGAAETIEGFVGVAAAEGQVRRAAHLAGASNSLRDELGIPLTEIDRARLDKWLEGPRNELGRDGFAAAWAEGSRMTTDQAIDYALGQASKLK